MPSEPYVCNPLTVAERNQKLRLVLDLRHMNKFLHKVTFKYKDIRTLEKNFAPGYYFATFDLSSGYHHVSIHPAFFKYLGFAWTFEDGSTRYFVFIVLPFGLSTACYVFTKLLRPFIKKWRGHGLHSIIYIDDGIFGTSSRRDTAYACLAVQTDLENAGLTINDEKSNLFPSQIGDWLGFTIDTNSACHKRKPSS